MKISKKIQKILEGKKNVKISYNLGKNGLPLIIGYKKSLYFDYLNGTKKVESKESKVAFMKTISMDKLSKFYPTIGKYTVFDVVYCATWLLKGESYVNAFIKSDLDFVPTLMYNKYLSHLESKIRQLGNNKFEWDVTNEKRLTYKEFCANILKDQRFMSNHGYVFENNVNNQVKKVVDELKFKSESSMNIANFDSSLPNVFNCQLAFNKRKKDGSTKLDLMVKAQRMEGLVFFPFAFTLYSLVLKVIAYECGFSLGKIHFLIDKIDVENYPENVEYDDIHFNIDMMRYPSPIYGSAIAELSKIPVI